MEHGAVVEINYSAKVVDGEVFDTTIKEIAEKAGILDENMDYKSNAIVVGAEELFEEVNNALKEMKVGEERKVLIDAEDAYGMRNPKLIRIVSFREFKKEKIQPFPGLIIDLNDRRGKVQSVSGGRVRVDFNHPLAGKDIEYDLKVEKEIKDLKEKVEVLFEKYFGPVPETDRELKVNVKEQEVIISLNDKYGQALEPLKKMFSDLLTKHIVGVKKVKYISKAEKSEKKENKKESKSEKKEDKKSEKKTKDKKEAEKSDDKKEAEKSEDKKEAKKSEEKSDDKKEAEKSEKADLVGIAKTLAGITDQVSTIVKGQEALTEGQVKLKTRIDEVSDIAKSAEEAVSGATKTEPEGDRSVTQKSETSRKSTLADTGY